MKKTVLVVEDDKWLAEQYSRILTNADYGVKTTTNANAAIYAVDDMHIDVIVLDVLLTGSTAFALLHELQSYSDTGLIPVVLCTNLASELSIDDLDIYGVKQILDKEKMKPNDLILAINKAL